MKVWKLEDGKHILWLLKQMCKHFILGDITSFKEAWFLIKLHIRYKNTKLK